MRYKENALETTDKMKQVLDTSIQGMDNHRISPEQLYKNLKQLNADLERLTVLINREPEEN